MSIPTEQTAATQNLDGSESHQTEVDYVKRFKDTQGAFTKSQQELKATQAQLKLLKDLVTPKVEISEETQKELYDLMYSDPQAWRQRMNSLENEAKQKQDAKFSEVEQTVSVQVELDRRASILEDYNRNHPNMPITDELIKLDVPPRITSKLEKGEITFDEYIEQVNKFLYTPKKVGSGQEVLNQPNLSNFGGGSEASDGAGSKDYLANYKNLTLL